MGVKSLPLLLGIVVAGCMGGQGGDEGAGPSKKKPTSDQSENGNADSEPFGAKIRISPKTINGSSTTGCYAEVWRSPETELEDYSCWLPSSGRGQENNAVDKTSADVSWKCDCNHFGITVDASDCESAVRSACGISENLPETFCRDSFDAVGTCWQAPDQKWQCRCGDPKGENPLVVQRDSKCEVALFHACAEPCQDALGQCQPAVSRSHAQYQCSCNNDDGTIHSIRDLGCELALKQACSAQSADGDSCEGHDGSCESDPQGGYTCNCFDGSSQSIASDAISAQACKAALEQSCVPEDRGSGDSQADPSNGVGISGNADARASADTSSIANADGTPFPMGNQSEATSPASASERAKPSSATAPADANIRDSNEATFLEKVFRGIVENAASLESVYKDPGKGAWEKGSTEYCKMDPAQFEDSGIDTYAVFRYGKLCYMKGNDAAADLYMMTHTLGGVMVGRASYLARNVPRTGPGTGPIQYFDLGTDWITSPSYARTDALITHIMAMVANASPSLDDKQLVFSYDGLGVEGTSDLIPATEKCIRQVSGLAADAGSFVQQQIFDRLGMPSSTWDSTVGLAGGFSANLSDLGKLGTLLLHYGWYGGERLLSTEWVYRMSHPAFESANTAFGHLMWVNHRGNASGGSDPNEGNDPCAPAAFWPIYPHLPSAATDCLATAAGASCDQKYDMGVFYAAALFGNFVVMHPGLDLVIVALNFGDGCPLGDCFAGPPALWRAIRPGLIALDPTYKDNEDAFCRDYGASSYVPDLALLASPIKPINLEK